MTKYRWIETGDGRKIYAKDPEFMPNHFGDAPMFIPDSMEPEYHHGVCRTIDSRKEWKEADKEAGTTTVSPREFNLRRENRAALKRAQERELKKDRHNASVEALKLYRENPQEVANRAQKMADLQVESAKKIGIETVEGLLKNG